MRIPLSHNEKFAVRDIYWSSESPLLEHVNTMTGIAETLGEFGLRLKMETRSFKIVRHNKMVVFGLGIGSTHGKLTLMDDAVATMFMLAIIDRRHKEIVAAYDDGQTINPMRIRPEDVVARHPKTGAVFATRLMLALGLIGGISLSSHRSEDRLIHKIC